MAALAGAQEPWPWTLRELEWRRAAVQLEEWDRAAWIAMFVLMPWSKKAHKFEDFNPLRAAEEAISLRETKEWLEEQHAKLPAKLSEEEIEARWQAACAKF